MKENKNQEELKNENINNENPSMEDAASKLLDDKVTELKAKLFMEVPEDAGFTTQQTLIVRDIILKAVNQAVEIGRLYNGLDNDSFKEVSESLNKMWSKLTDPSANVKAESISKLYHLQRYIINNLVAVIQSQHTIAGIIEAEGKPYKNTLDLTSALFGTAIFGKNNATEAPILEKQPLL